MQQAKQQVRQKAVQQGMLQVIQQILKYTVIIIEHLMLGRALYEAADEQINSLKVFNEI